MDTCLLLDVLIGPFATRHQGLLTRNAKDFARLLPDLKAGEWSGRNLEQSVSCVALDGHHGSAGIAHLFNVTPRPPIR